MADDLKKRIKNTPKEGRQFGVVLESIDSNVKHIVEAVDTHTKQIGELQKQTGRIETRLEKMDTRLSVIETTLESVNLPVLKQKFISLEKRVAVLESKER